MYNFLPKKQIQIKQEEIRQTNTTTTTPKKVKITENSKLLDQRKNEFISFYSFK